MLLRLTGRHQLESGPPYAITKDNFYKMCLIYQRAMAGLPSIIMGETGIGKTSLIEFLTRQVLAEPCLVMNIHAGINEQVLAAWVEQMNATARSRAGRVWVFFDEFNTSDIQGYVCEMVKDRTFRGEPVPPDVVFVAACNPYAKRSAVLDKGLRVGPERVRAGLDSAGPGEASDLVYKVLPPPEAMREFMWDYQSLCRPETLAYITTIIEELNYRTADVAHVLLEIHDIYKTQVGMCSVSLRDVSRFKILCRWFDGGQHPGTERAFILALYFCYSIRLPSETYRTVLIETAEKRMGMERGHMACVVKREQL